MATSLDKGKYYKRVYTQEYGIHILSDAFDATTLDPSTKPKQQLLVFDSMRHDKLIDHDWDLKDWVEITKEEFDEIAGR